VRDRLASKRDEVDIPEPEANDSPFDNPEVEQAQSRPLGNPDIAAEVYGAGTDPWTGRALQLLEDRGIAHEFVDLEAEGGVKLHARLVGDTKEDNAPYVFVRGAFVGGFNALNEIDRLGQLEAMIQPDSDGDGAPGRTRIVVAKREREVRPPGEVGNPDDRG
jgi:glutaredoxin